MITVKLETEEAVFFHNFMEGAKEQMEQQCSVAEAKDPGVQLAFNIFQKVIQQLSEQLSEEGS